MSKHSLKARLLGLLFLVGLFAIVDIGLNYTVYNPVFITPVYGFFLKHHVLSEEGSGYPLVSIRSLNESRFSGPRATVEARVIQVLRSGDGDTHMTIESPDGVLVTEMVPEYPLPLPAVGDLVKIWGITRYDIAHRWWELHPVFGWEKITQ